MIKIILKNFRKFEKKEFLFDKHLTLISGKSGKGKTTIFMAIIFALTGEGKKLITYGKTSCSVILEINPWLTTGTEIRKICIMRSKRPNRLTLQAEPDTLKSQTYEDKEAQAIIDDMFPQYYLGYMSQRVDNKSFILMSPMDKMRFIQKIAFGNENVDILHKNCRDLIRVRKDDMMLTSRERETTEKMLGDLKIKKYNDDKENEKDEEHEELLDKIKQLEKNIEHKKRLLDKTLSLLKFKEDLKTQLDSIPKINADICQIEDQIKRMHLQMQSWDNYQKEKKKLDKLKKPSDFKKEDIKIMISDMKQMIELQNQMKSMNDFKKKLELIEKQIQDVSIPMKCPECKKEIELWCDKNGNATLRQLSNEQQGFKKSLTSYEEVKNIEQKRYKLQLQLQELEKKEKELLLLKEEYPDLDDPKYQLDELYQIWRDDEEYEKQKNVCDSFKIKEIPKNCNDSFLSELKQQQKNIYTRNEKELNYNSIIIKDNIENLKDEIVLLNTELNDTKERQNYCQSVKYWNKVDKLSKHEEVLNKSYPRAVKLQNIIKQAEKLAIEETIEQINLHVQLYLDYFLENVTVCLAFDKDGTRLNVNVTQNNFESDLNNLSGGELARVILAFTIALADMNNVKLLLLDECVSSLDQETTTSVIKTIQNNFTGQIICIAHQTTTGIFDHVEEL
ncbi:MAG: AAA family ATPase [Cetobacterium sp.]